MTLGHENELISRPVSPFQRQVLSGRRPNYSCIMNSWARSPCTWSSYFDEWTSFAMPTLMGTIQVCINVYSAYWVSSELRSVKDRMLCYSLMSFEKDYREMKRRSYYLVRWCPFRIDFRHNQNFVKLCHLRNNQNFIKFEFRADKEVDFPVIVA